MFTQRQQYIRERRGGSTLQDSLYHGCDDKIIDIVCKTGFIVPADYDASPHCPVSGHLVPRLPPSSSSISSPGFGVTGSLCNTDCTYCTNKHAWNKCHMFGLGIYFANMASKSANYVKGTPVGSNKRMMLCRVELGTSYIHQKLFAQDTDHGVVVPKAGYDSITVKADPAATAGSLKLSVALDEYILFHPFQVIPEYIIEYQ